MVHDVVPRVQCLEQAVELEVLGYVNLGHVAATEAEVAEDILAQRLEFGEGLRAVQHRDADPVLADDPGQVAEVVLEVAGRVVAARGDHGLHGTQFLRAEVHALRGAGKEAVQGLHQRWDQQRILGRGLDPCTVA